MTQQEEAKDLDGEEAKDGDFDPARPDDEDSLNNDNEVSDIEDEEMMEESDQEVEVERNMNFVTEFAQLATYDVISKYTYAMKTEKLFRQSEVVVMTADFFRRVVFQLKAPYIFYQLEYLNVFYDLLKQDQCNNSLMKSFTQMNQGGLSERMHRSAFETLKQVVIQIISNFVTLQKVNPMLAVEALFRFPNRETVE